MGKWYFHEIGLELSFLYKVHIVAQIGTQIFTPNQSHENTTFPFQTTLLTVQHPTINPYVWVNVSTDWGIGIMLGHLWATWRLKPSWKIDGHDIGWAESIALELAIL